MCIERPSCECDRGCKSWFWMVTTGRRVLVLVANRAAWVMMVCVRLNVFPPSPSLLLPVLSALVLSAVSCDGLVSVAVWALVLHVLLVGFVYLLVLACRFGRR